MSNGSKLRDRAAWIEGDRAKHYRNRAEHFEEIAKSETEPRTQARLAELAGEYHRLADDADRQNERSVARPRKDDIPGV